MRQGRLVELNAWGTLLGVSLGLIGLVASAQAQSHTALSWVRLPGAEQCIAAAELGEAIAERVGGSPVFVPPELADRLVEGRVERCGAGFCAVVAMTDRTGRALGQRDVQSGDPDCRALDGPLVLVLAAAVSAEVQAPPKDGNGREVGEVGNDARREGPLPDLEGSLAQVARVAAVESNEAKDSANADPASVPGPKRLPPDDGRASASPDASTRIWLRAGGSLDLGLQPDIAPGANWGIALDAPGYPLLGVEAHWLAEQRIAKQGAGVDLQPWWVEAWVCQARSRAGGLAPELCLALSVGRLHGRGVRVSEPVEPDARFFVGRSWLVQVGPRVGLRYAWGPFALWIRLGLSLQLNRDSFEFRRRAGELTSLHRVGSLAFGTALGAEVGF